MDRVIGTAISNRSLGRCCPGKVSGNFYKENAMFEVLMCFALVVAIHVVVFAAVKVAFELAKRCQPETA
jgi:hypothetical protein